MKTRLVALVLALPLAAFDCGGEEELGDRFGLGCTLQLAGGVAPERMSCIMTAYDYSAFPDPDLQSPTWVFQVVAYRDGFQVGAGAGIFLDGRPALGTTYGWDGDAAAGMVLSGGAERYEPGAMQQSHHAYSLGPGSGEGKLSVRFTTIPPADATDAALLGVHGTLTATLPPDPGYAGTATLSVSF
jgi:hypothetical protein